ncbi:MAG: hypothetical protein OHK0048_11920 [Rhodoferax sp.]
MHIVSLAWIYVAGLMALAEASGPSGTLLGASLTFLLYGVLPLSIVLYIMGTPARRRARQRAQEQAQAPQNVASGPSIPTTLDPTPDQDRAA